MGRLRPFRRPTHSCWPRGTRSAWGSTEHEAEGSVANDAVVQLDEAQTLLQEEDDELRQLAQDECTALTTAVGTHACGVLHTPATLVHVQSWRPSARPGADSDWPMQLQQQETSLVTMLLPKDEDDQRGVVLEVRAGAGGEEAALFAMDLLLMYQQFAALSGWSVEVGHRARILHLPTLVVLWPVDHSTGAHRQFTALWRWLFSPPPDCSHFVPKGGDIS
jgi:hypothetical protein